MKDKPRKRWVAGLLSLFMPGMGQIYNGQFRKGILLLLTTFFFLKAGTYVAMHYLPGQVLWINILAVAIFLAMITVAVRDAVKTAGKLREHYTPKRYNRFLVYFAIPIVAGILCRYTDEYLRSNLNDMIWLNGSSMNPTLLDGDCIVIDKTSSGRHPKRGDIVKIGIEGDPRSLAKRVVAVGGDTIEIRDKQVYLNGEPLVENYVIHSDPEVLPASESPRDNLDLKEVPPSSYLVMGDNRDLSDDSRFHGYVNQDKIVGTFKSVFLSRDREKGEFRWSRFGMVIE